MSTIANWNISEYVTLILPPPQLKIEEVRYTSSSKEATACRMGSTQSHYIEKAALVNLFRQAQLFSVLHYMHIQMLVAHFDAVAVEAVTDVLIQGEVDIPIVLGIAPDTDGILDVAGVIRRKRNERGGV